LTYAIIRVMMSNKTSERYSS